MSKVPPPTILSPVELLEQDRRSNVIVNLKQHRKADVYIDNLIPMGLWSDCCTRLIGTILLAMEYIGQLVNELDPLLWEPLLILNKLLMESKLS